MFRVEFEWVWLMDYERVWVTLNSDRTSLLATFWRPRQTRTRISQVRESDSWLDSGRLCALHMKRLVLAPGFYLVYRLCGFGARILHKVRFKWRVKPLMYWLPCPLYLSIRRGVSRHVETKPNEWPELHWCTKTSSITCDKQFPRNNLRLMPFNSPTSHKTI